MGVIIIALLWPWLMEYAFFILIGGWLGMSHIDAVHSICDLYDTWKKRRKNKKYRNPETSDRFWRQRRWFGKNKKKVDGRRVV
jgi:hypothetical protein